MKYASLTTLKPVQNKIFSTTSIFTFTGTCILANYFFVVTIFLAINFYTIEKPVYFPVTGTIFVREVNLWVEQLG